MKRLEAQDYNRDGALNEDGFKAALLIDEVGMKADELEEAYNLNVEGEDLPY